MATPQSTTSSEDPSGPKKLEQITFRFCSECSNMLYPKEDEDAHRLQFTCRTCQFTEPAGSTCVFRNVLNNSAGETAGVTQDVGSDPTVSQVPHVICLTCGTIILCEYCPRPVTLVSVIKPEGMEKEEGAMGLAYFVLDFDNDPSAEYEEEPPHDDADSGGWAAGLDGGGSAAQSHGSLGASSDDGSATCSIDLAQWDDVDALGGAAVNGDNAMIVHL